MSSTPTTAVTADRQRRVRRGQRYPVGATWTPQGTNFSVFSQSATGMELLLYQDVNDTQPSEVIRLDPRWNRSFHFWHVWVDGLPAGTRYNWRVTDSRGEHCEVVDPFARATDDRQWDRAAAAQPDGRRNGLRGIVTDPDDFRWPGEAPPAVPLAGAVIYELHVGGFTRHPSSGVSHPGSFAGLAEKIPYLRDLGITHVQLLPVAAFDPQDVPPQVARRGLTNFWGYSPHSFLSPHPGFCASDDPADAPREFRAMVQAFHDAGIGVILDVVMNHTAEGGASGPVINYKGVTPEFFYIRDGERFLDFTGCGNTINCNHPLVTRLLVRTLEAWVEEMRVDGFRFDLASIFTRGEDGEPMKHPPLPWAIEFSRTLANRPLIAEAWDAAGLYHVGSFPGLSWSEWNGRYRDVMRRFARGDTGLVGEVATCVAGSSDLYQSSGRMTSSTINFITCHDGFTLADLVSYREKHNEANGEQNRDGSNQNFSWNCGTEGESWDPAVTRLRQQHARNMLSMLLLSQGVPMLLAGDELLRTQRGNNNAWCHDDELSWLDWRLAETNEAMLRFVRAMIAFRRRHPTLSRPHFLTGSSDPERGLPDIQWHGARLADAPWDVADARLLRYTLAASVRDEEDLHVILNMGDRSETLELPSIAGRRWHLAVDTSLPPPDEIVDRDRQVPWPGRQYLSRPRSVVVLEARAV
jgi:glycogen operon protein